MQTNDFDSFVRSNMYSNAKELLEIGNNMSKLPDYLRAAIYKRLEKNIKPSQIFKDFVYYLFYIFV